MRINDAHNSWAKYSQTINDFVTPAGTKRSKKHLSFKKIRPYQRFLAWPLCPKRHISALSGYTRVPQLDLRQIEQFLKRHASLAQTEPLLRTSPLLNHATHEWHGPALEKAVAIKRMASLMHETLVVMKSLTLIQATHHRA
jgi:hypothetical protein